MQETHVDREIYGQGTSFTKSKFHVYIDVWNLLFVLECRPNFYLFFLNLIFIFHFNIACCSSLFILLDS